MKTSTIIFMLLTVLLGFFLTRNIFLEKEDHYLDFAQIAKDLRENNGKIPRANRKPSDWFYNQRAYPLDSISPQKVFQARQETKNLQQKTSRGKFSQLEWESLGPTNIPGRITAFVVHPSNTSIIYAGSATGGVFKSTDKGQSWTPIFDDAGVARGD